MVDVIFVFLADVSVAVVLYQLLKPISRTLSMLTAAFRQVSEELDTTWFDAPMLLGSTAVAAGNLAVAQWAAEVMLDHARRREIRLLEPEGMWVKAMVMQARNEPEPARNLLGEARRMATAMGSSRPPGGSAELVTSARSD